MTPEQKARKIIDKLFASSGWQVVDREHYAPNISAAAIEEGLLNHNMEADYLLFINGKAVGVLEAKKEDVETLIFTPTGIEVKVADDDKIEYKGRLYKLSPFTGTFMPEEKRNTSGAYQGAKFFSYKGEILDDIRKKLESR